MRQARITKILVHAEFACDRCGLPATRLTTCPVVIRPAKGLIDLGEPDDPGHPLRCPKCQLADREEESDLYNKQAARLRWFKAHKAARPTPGRGPAGGPGKKLRA